MHKPTPQIEAFIQKILLTNESIRLEAVAGSGKTTTLKSAAGLLPPEDSTIALAFNKKIQEKMSEIFPSHITCATFNGLGSRIVRGHLGKAKLSKRKMGDITNDACANFDVLDEWSNIRKLASQLKAEGIVPANYEAKANKNARIASMEITQQIAAHHDIVASSDTINIALVVLSISIQQALEEKIIDFDDQLYISTYFTPTFLWDKYSTVLVDEAQDLSSIQHDMIAMLLKKGGRVIAVGDSNQAIYGWRGAASNSLDLLEERFNMTRMPLSVCFRCPSEVVEEAQQYVPEIQAFRKPSTSTPVKTADRWSLQEIPLGSVIICRNNAPLVRLAFECMRSGIPSFFSKRDLAASFNPVLKSLSDTGLKLSLDTWRANETTKLTEEMAHREANIQDIYETLAFIIDETGADTAAGLGQEIAKLFPRSYTEEGIELTTIHRAKGKEWDHVYFLDQELIPSPYIDQANDRLSWMIDQEYNLSYVAITRALETLTYISSKRKD